MSPVILAEFDLESIAVWFVAGCAAVMVLMMFVLWIVSARNLAVARTVINELRNQSADIRRWSEVAQRQTELANAPLLKVVEVKEVVGDQGRGMQIEVRNVGFGSAVNVKCIMTDRDDSEYVSPHTEIVGNETGAFELPILIESVQSIRFEYLSQGGSYAHTTQYAMKSGAQSYALHRTR